MKCPELATSQLFFKCLPLADTMKQRRLR